MLSYGKFDVVPTRHDNLGQRHIVLGIDSTIVLNLLTTNQNCLPILYTLVLDCKAPLKRPRIVAPHTRTMKQGN